MSQQAATPRSSAIAAVLTLSLGLVLAACHNDNPEAPLAEARHYRSQGQLPAAVAQLRQVLQGDADNRAARRMLGELYLEQGELLAAERELRRALLLGADPGPVTLLLGRTLLLQGQYTRVLNEISPVSPSAQRPATLSLRANAALELGDLDGARDMFNQALSFHPDSPEALLGLARIALYQNQAGISRQLVSRALATHPDDADILRFRDDLARSDPGDISQSVFNAARR